MPIYTASSTIWPVLQTLDEVKHRSGLFAATATYIRPAGNAAIPTTIPTSIGDLSLWPAQPTVSKDTSGFERLTATAYGIWDGDVSEVTFAYRPIQLIGEIKMVNRCVINNYFENGKLVKGCGKYACGELNFNNISVYPTKSQKFIVSSCTIRTIGEGIPNAPALPIYNLNREELGGVSDSFLGIPSMFFKLFNNGYNYNYFYSYLNTTLSSYSEKKYGEIIEKEAIYTIEKNDDVINFGTFNEPEFLSEYNGCVDPTE